MVEGSNGAWRKIRVGITRKRDANNYRHSCKGALAVPMFLVDEVSGRRVMYRCIHDAKQSGVELPTPPGISGPGSVRDKPGATPRSYIRCTDGYKKNLMCIPLSQGLGR